MLELEVNGKRERIRTGLHICQFYTHPSETVQTAEPFIRNGLRNGERCWVATTPERLDDFRAVLSEERVDVENVIDSGQLMLVDDKEPLLADEKFDPYHLLSQHQSLITRSLSEGWPTVRVVLDLSWLAAGIATTEQLLKYEAAADAIFTFQNRPVIVLAQYRYSDLPEDVAVELLRLHPISVVGKFIKRNPYYVDSEHYMVQIIRRSQQRRTARTSANGRNGRARLRSETTAAVSAAQTGDESSAAPGSVAERSA